MMRYSLPLLAFIILAIFLGIGLTLDPRVVPSPLVGKPAPAFNLPQLNAPDKMFSPADMRGKVWLLNVWASWCSACRSEHAQWLELANSGNVNIIGLDYKDEPLDAQRWLTQLGDPYQTVVVDRDGKAGLDYGVYGVPETFVIDKKGVIRHKQIGALDAEIVQTELLPLLQQLNNEPGS